MGAMDSSLLQDQIRGIEEARLTCLRNYGEESLLNSFKPYVNDTHGTLCPAYFDEIMCWPPTPANTTASFQCPKYLIGFNVTQNATRKCMQDGLWYKNNESLSWTNYTSCIISEETLIPVAIDLNNSIHYIERYIPTIKIISRTGYSVSLFTLVIAFMIMFSIKKLHCPRNKLHMHLFASFIFRAFIFLLKDLIFVEGVGLNSDIKFQNGNKYFFEDKNSGNWCCKMVTSLFQFFITANYSWILMEGLYLHNLIFHSMFVDSNKSIVHYIILGWGMPLLVTTIWIIARILFEDTLCWTTHDNNLIFLIVRIPTAISILLNLILFVRIAVVIYSKLQAPVYEEAKRYQKWARSTLVLAPLFGIHYALLIGMSSWMNKNEMIELIWLIADQLFASFQGFFVAILYCFMNSEVRAELKPQMQAFFTFVATNNCLKYCFPCRHSYLRSSAGRPSVCTTMSCSSLFNNGINHHRNSRSRQSNIFPPLDKNRESTYRSSVISWHETAPSRWSGGRFSAESKSIKNCNFNSNGSIPNERMACLIIEDKNRPDSSQLLVGESICMLPRNAGA